MILHVSRLSVLRSQLIRQLISNLKLIPRYLEHLGFKAGFIRLIKTSIQNGISGLITELDRVRAANNWTTHSGFEYLIMAPDYRSNSAGVRCLYRLCHDLNELGYSAAVTGALVGPTDMNIPMVSFSTAREMAAGTTWFIYPEIVTGNPFKAKNVIRWVLNRPGLLGGERFFDERELVFAYSKKYLPYIQNRVQGLLSLPTLDRTIFYPPAPGAKRSLACYYVGKSTYKEGHFERSETLEITQTVPLRKDLGNLLRASRVLYCFDNSTALVQESVACGCPVVIILDSTHTRADHDRAEFKVEGIMWNEHDPSIQVDLAAVAQNYANMRATYREELGELVQLTNENFNRRIPTDPPQNVPRTENNGVV